MRKLAGEFLGIKSGGVRIDSDGGEGEAGGRIVGEGIVNVVDGAGR